MRQLSFKHALMIALLSLLLPTVARADAPEDTIKMPIMETPVTTRYHQRLAKRQEHWNRLIPSLFILQYAGDIGMLAGGLGWDYGRSNQWETHLTFGYIPPHQHYKHYWTFTLREMFLPWNLRFGKSWSVRPLSISLAANSMLDGDFWSSEPERYPRGYYQFSSKIRFQLGLGQRISWAIPEKHRFLSQQISLYYEIVTCDLYVRQKFLSKKIPLKDIIAIGIGVIYTI